MFQFHRMNSRIFLAAVLALCFSTVLFSCDESDSSSTAESSSTAPAAAAPGPAPKPAPKPQGLQPPYPISDSSKIFTVDGIQIYIVEQGTGPKPLPGSHVVMNYRGTLLDGSEFDSSFGKQGYMDFDLNGLIEGWKIGLPQVQTGSKVKLIIPPEKGYGAAARTGIPANSTLVFDIDLASTY